MLPDKIKTLHHPAGEKLPRDPIFRVNVIEKVRSEPMAENVQEVNLSIRPLRFSRTCALFSAMLGDADRDGRHRTSFEGKRKKALVFPW